jgi:myo-inositol-1-phosphate synthase
MQEHAGRTGVWLIGARGGLATTLLAGVKLIARGLVSAGGLLTETEAVKGVTFPKLSDLVFGGHDIRAGTVHGTAVEIYRETGTIPYDKLEAVRDELDAIDPEIRLGTSRNCGPAIQRLASARARAARGTLQDDVDRLSSDMAGFRDRHRLRTVIVVNLASTEPPTRPHKGATDAAAFRKALQQNGHARREDPFRASTLYAAAAAQAGFPYINFTPSNGALPPALQSLFSQAGLPFMGNDGKTGETLVKSALAPMFKYRNLRVLAWQGYNILGDRDGLILSDASNRQSKIESKDSVLASILGYKPHTHVGIDYVPSLSDLKTAWDFVHFRGFLDYKMSLQFIWQGCDAVLAAPLVLDLVRFAALARDRGEKGPMRHLACFFKDPVAVSEQDLHGQFHQLIAYVEQARSPRRAKPPGRRGGRAAAW